MRKTKKHPKEIYLLTIFIAVFGLGFFAFTSQAQAAPSITSPAPNATLSGSSVNFTWNANGTAVTAWYLWAGPCDSAALGGCGDDYYNSGELGSGTLTANATGLLTNGSMVYVRLWYQVSGNWQSVLNSYIAMQSNGCSQGVCYADNSSSAISSCNNGDLDYNPNTRTCGTGNNEIYLKIQMAVDNAHAGNSINVKPGVYYERIEIANSGNENNPITITGERGQNDEWLTIIDGSDATSGWVPATEIDPQGNGAYKTTNIDYASYAMIAKGDKSILVITDLDHFQNGLDGWRILSMRPNESYNNRDFGTVEYFDGHQAYAGYHEGVTYIRFKDGQNPNEMNVRSSPGGPDCDNRIKNDFVFCPIKGSAILIQNKSNIILKDFLIRGARYSVEMIGPDSYNNVIDSNHMMNGNGRVYLGYGAHDNNISNNKMELNPFGAFNPGPWKVKEGYLPEGISMAELNARSSYYWYHKNFVSGWEASADSGVRFYLNGLNNKVFGNKIFNGCVGIGIIGLDPNGNHIAKDIEIYDNEIFNMSGEGIMINRFAEEIDIHDNLIYNNMKNIRIQHVELGGKSARIYNNKFYNPQKIGEHIYWHQDPTCTDSPQFPSDPDEMRIYHNSFSGGLSILGFGAAFHSNGLTNTYFINNIFSTNFLLYDLVEGYPNCNPEGDWEIGIFDHNWIGANYLNNNAPIWARVNANIQRISEVMWNFNSAPDFVIPNGSDAINSGLDLSVEQTIDGKTFGPLPGINASYYGDGFADLGAIQFGNNPADVNNDGSVNSQDITLCVNVILDIEKDPVIVARAKAVVPDVQVCDTLDLTTIVNEILK